MPTVTLPTLHPGQVNAFNVAKRFKAIRCGRRWGKTEYGKTEACDSATRKQLVGWFAPDYKRISEAYAEIHEILEPVMVRSNQGMGVMRTKGGGRIDFWTLDDLNAGRSRKYHKVIIDEAAFTKPNMMDIWRKSIRPTLLDYRGRAIVLSNASGIDEENFFWRICNQPEHGFTEYHAPCHQNPFLPAEELAKLESENHPLVYAQEYLAEFVDWRGVAFFELDKMLVEGQPAEPSQLDAVYVVIDTAVKSGKEHDGTAAVFFGINKRDKARPLWILDWEYVQMDANLLISWLPTMLMRATTLAERYKGRLGNLGAWVEDKYSGSILVQQAQAKNMNVRPIDTKLTAMGKDERAIAASPYVYQGLVKLTPNAHDKVSTFKTVSRNHLLSQVLGFKIGDKDAAKRADDLLDDFCYGVVIGLGGRDGV